LYEPQPGVFRLHVPRGQAPAMFKSRYEGPIRRAVEALTHTGNQILDFI